MDYPELLAKCDEMQEVIDKTHERLDNMIAAGSIPMPAPLRAQALAECLQSLRGDLTPHISYDPM